MQYCPLRQRLLIPMAQPFLNAVTGVEDISVIAFPGVAAGAFRIAVTTRLWGVEADGLANLYQWRGLRVDGLAGLRFLQFNESVTMGTQTVGVAGLPLIGGQYSAGVDDFNVNNNFFLANRTNASGGTARGTFTLNGGTANVNCDITDNSTTGTRNTTLTLDGGTRRRGPERRRPLTPSRVVPNVPPPHGLTGLGHLSPSENPADDR